MRRISLLLALVASLFVTPALADFTGKDASLATITFKNPGVCTSVVCTPIFAQFDSTGTNAVAVLTLGADAASNTATGALSYARNMVFNGTTWDRWTGIVQGTGASGAALAGNPFRVGLSDGTNSQNWLAAIALADGVNGNNTGAVAQWYWNGTTFDRAKGDATNGAFVNVKTSVLPTGGSTSANQTSELTKLDTLHTDLGTLNTTAGSSTPACAAAPCVTTIGNTGQMANVGGTDTKSIKCGSSIVYDASTSGSTQLVALSGATSVYVCGYSIMAGGTVNVKLITGTGTACVTGTASITPAWQLTAQAGLVDGSPEYRGLKGAASSELCINTSGAVAVQAIVYYTQF